VSFDVPKAGGKTPEDWRTAMIQSARAAGSRIATRERTKNPAIPDNFLDFSEAGFPADLDILPVQIPRPSVPQEMTQYRDVVNRQWQHVPWQSISSNGGQDGKAHVPGAIRHDLGGGMVVAVVANNYLMYADKHQHADRRARHVEKSSENLKYKMESVEDGYQRDATDTGPMTIEQLFDYEKSIGEEPALKGVKL